MRTGRQPYRIIDSETAAIPLTKGYEALVDLEDADRVSKFPWLANEPWPGYVRALRIVNRTSLFMHHFILDITDGSEIDHIDRDGLNNKKLNLKPSTHTENMRNTNRHKFRVGYTYNKRAKLWMAYLDEPDKKRRYLGYTKTELQAIILVERARCQS